MEPWRGSGRSKLWRRGGPKWSREGSVLCRAVVCRIGITLMKSKDPDLLQKSRILIRINVKRGIRIYIKVTRIRNISKIKKSELRS
jgi:hypothetical protein